VTTDNEQRQLLEALEIIKPGADEGQVFLAWGRLIDDPTILFEQSPSAAVLAMSVEERRELSARVKNQLKDTYGWIF
jgi:hypothetical protein